MIIYDPKNWYWIIAGDEALVYSSARDAVVVATDPAYVEWCARGLMPTRIEDTVALAGVLANAGAQSALFAPVPASISDRQFFQQLAAGGIISQDEALASNAAVIPPPLLALVDQLPDQAQFDAKMKISGATTFYRADPLTIAIGEAYGWTDAELDAFFIAAGAL